MRPLVLLDCDGPLSDFTRAYLDAFAEETGESHAVAEVDRFAIWDCPFYIAAAERMGITHRALRDLVDAHVELSGFCEDIPVQPDAQEAVAKLVEVAEVFVVTSPWHSSRTWVHERTAWVKTHFSIPSKQVIYAQVKHLIRGDVLLDDRPSHVEEWGRAWPDADAILFGMGHNVTEGAGLRRGGWGEVIEAVRVTKEKAA